MKTADVKAIQKMNEVGMRYETKESLIQEETSTQREKTVEGMITEKKIRESVEGLMTENTFTTRWRMWPEEDRLPQSEEHPQEMQLVEDLLLPEDDPRLPKEHQEPDLHRDGMKASPIPLEPRPREGMKALQDLRLVEKHPLRQEDPPRRELEKHPGRDLCREEQRHLDDRRLQGDVLNLLEPEMCQSLDQRLAEHKHR